MKLFSYKAQIHLTKAFPMEGNTIHSFTITKRTLSRRNSFMCMIKGTNLTSLYTQLDILFLPPVAPIFPLLCWSYHGKLPFYRWSHSIGMLSTHWYYTAGTANHTKISHHISISLNLHYWIHDYFTLKYILLYFNYYYSY